MPNKISGLNPAAIPDTAPPAVPGGAARSSTDAAPSSAGDLHITDSASQLASLEQTLRSLPAIDPVRVAQFQTAIDQGTYTVQPQHVADRLVQLESALAQLQKG